ncbi:MAG: helix-turn-helix domain-containing protein [Clostridia bacterium]|nr:helix-turn-helix domain-containing protein [Clostridia bacterium]
MAIINYIEKHLKTFTVKSHKHNYWEIIYVTEGVGTIETEDAHVIEYKKGEMICIPPNIRHINNSSLGFKNIHFTIEDWNPPLQTPLLIPYSDSSKDFYTVLKLTYRYFHQLPANHPINLAFTHSIEAFLNRLIQQSEAYNITQIIVHEIINHYTETKFDLDEAYKLVPLSKEHLRKLFIKEHGISPSKFLLQKRLTLAKQLLSKKEDGYLRINEIAEACGFDDHAYFCRVFKKETGLAPNEFQLRLLEDNKIYPVKINNNEN